MVETISLEVEKFFEEVVKEVGEVADSFIAFSEEVAEQLHEAIAPDLEQLDEQLEAWIDPLVRAVIGFESSVSEAAQPLTHTVDPILNEHPACVGCRHYHGQSYGGNMLVCGMHPYGWESEKCPDWQSVWGEDESLN